MGFFGKKTTKLPFKLLVLALKKLAVGFLDLNLSAVFGWPSSNWTQADLHQPAAAIFFGPTCHAWCPWAASAQGHVNVTILTFWDFGFGWHFEVLVGTENSIQVVFLILKLPFKIAERFESNWLAHIFFWDRWMNLKQNSARKVWVSKVKKIHGISMRFSKCW